MNLLGLLLISLALGLLAWLAFLWSVRSGQYEDPEGPKYRMLDDEDEAPRPAGEGRVDAPRDPSQGQTPGGP